MPKSFSGEKKIFQACEGQFKKIFIKYFFKALLSTLNVYIFFKP